MLLLENVRFYPEEEKNDPEFAKKLAAPADLYVNDAFGTAHRAHASTEGVTKFLSPSVAGFLLQKELDYLGELAAVVVVCVCVCVCVFLCARSALPGRAGRGLMCGGWVGGCGGLQNLSGKEREPGGSFPWGWAPTLPARATRRWRRDHPQAPLCGHRGRLQGLLQDRRD